MGPELLRTGDRRNVVDRYRYWRVEAVVADLDTRRHPFHVAVENWRHDLNIGSVVRTANAMGAAAFHVVGRRRWNRRGAMVTDRYQHEHHHPDAAGLAAWAATAGRGGARIPLVGVDNVPGAVPLETFDLPRECVLVLGQESVGLSAAMQDECDVVLHIAQFGSTRSVNAGAAAAVAMHAWVRRHVFGQAPLARYRPGIAGPAPTAGPVQQTLSRRVVGTRESGAGQVRDLPATFGVGECPARVALPLRRRTPRRGLRPPGQRGRRQLHTLRARRGEQPGEADHEGHQLRGNTAASLAYDDKGRLSLCVATVSATPSRTRIRTRRRGS